MAMVDGQSVKSVEARQYGCFYLEGTAVASRITCECNVRDSPEHLAEYALACGVLLRSSSQLHVDNAPLFACPHCGFESPGTPRCFLASSIVCKKVL